MLDRRRFGSDLKLPFVRSGIYLNVGQLADLLLGLSTLDIAEDGAADSDDEEVADPVDGSKL